MGSDLFHSEQSQSHTSNLSDVSFSSSGSHSGHLSFAVATDDGGRSGSTASYREMSELGRNGDRRSTNNWGGSSQWGTAKRGRSQSDVPLRHFSDGSQRKGRLIKLGDWAMGHMGRESLEKPSDPKLTEKLLEESRLAKLRERATSSSSRSSRSSRSSSNCSSSKGRTPAALPTALPLMVIPEDGAGDRNDGVVQEQSVDMRLRGLLDTHQHQLQSMLTQHQHEIRHLLAGDPTHQGHAA